MKGQVAVKYGDRMLMQEPLSCQRFHLVSDARVNTDDKSSFFNIHGSKSVRVGLLLNKISRSQITFGLYSQ